mmetsp:Transcript_67092/g.185805  ORF Transcript_67092/g.185805 Transcript_67092/m.185805 type:complete len:231 (+) Transcript_67092:1319-2011(+)
MGLLDVPALLLVVPAAGLELDAARVALASVVWFEQATAAISPATLLEAGRRGGRGRGGRGGGPRGRRGRGRGGRGGRGRRGGSERHRDPRRSRRSFRRRGRGGGGCGYGARLRRVLRCRGVCLRPLRGGHSRGLRHAERVPAEVVRTVAQVGGVGAQPEGTHVGVTPFRPVGVVGKDHVVVWQLELLGRGNANVLAVDRREACTCTGAICKEAEGHGLLLIPFLRGGGAC